ncbi:hypothetical protein MMC17_002966 [Xylographa soralifera]|nr:hypothetical protein [Xylographa soralifera]
MLGKLGMSIEECITQYKKLSVKIFKKKHLRSRFTGGLAQHKYSGECLRQCVSNLIHEKGFPRDMPMLCGDSEDSIACAVVCRELTSSSKYSRLKSGAVCICNLPCTNNLPHTVCDAARATSAAPTFFPVVRIGDRCFVDGGMEYNNPSYAIQNHYAHVSAESSRLSITTTPKARHGELDLTRVRYINIGTGTKTVETPDRRRDVLASLLPSVIRMGVFLKETLTQIAVNSEHTAEMMKSLEQVSHGDIIYKRFSARNEVCFFKLDRYTDLHKIESLTMQYIKEHSTQDSLKAVAKAITDEWVARRRCQAGHQDATGIVSTPARTPTLIDDVKSAPGNVDCNREMSPVSNVLTPASVGSSNVYSNFSNRTTRNITTGSDSQNSTPITEYDEETPNMCQASPILANQITA